MSLVRHIDDLNKQGFDELYRRIRKLFTPSNRAEIMLMVYDRYPMKLEVVFIYDKHDITFALTPFGKDIRHHRPSPQYHCEGARLFYEELLDIFEKYDLVIDVDKDQTWTISSHGAPVFRGKIGDGELYITNPMYYKV